MAQDFAKRHSSKASAKSSVKPAVPGWAWFLTGLSTGLFTAFLVFLWQSPAADPVTSQQAAAPKAGNSARTEDSASETMQWDFFEMFPRAEVPIVEEYGPDGSNSQVATPHRYLLQAGSFRNPDDADKLRAELILLGLDVFIKVIKNDGQTWHRVMVGPIDNETDLSRNRNVLAEASIESLSLRISP